MFALYKSRVMQFVNVVLISVTMKSLLSSFSLLEVRPLGEVVGLLSGARENMSVVGKLHPNHCDLKNTRLLLKCMPLWR